ncbi:MAG: hypothetical protein SYC29_02890 [Planctomycetota bacterium]|nr:hypothetical protein [Planctomycetota bacterium]
MKRAVCAALVVGALTVSAQAAGPVSDYYIIDGGNFNCYLVNGLNVTTLFQTRDDQMPLAVADTIRTYGEYPEDFGSEYDLSGNWLGVDFPAGGGPDGQRIDGTTDGSNYNYMAAWNDASIWEFDRLWDNGRELFEVPGGATGVTYDVTTGNLWVIAHGDQQVQEFALDGTLLSSFAFNTDSGWMGALAYEPASDTLWATDYSNGDMYNFAKDGTVIDVLNYPELAGYAWGGEFAIPAPATLSLLTLSLLGVRRRR